MTARNLLSDAETTQEKYMLYLIRPQVIQCMIAEHIDQILQVPV